MAVRIYVQVWTNVEAKVSEVQPRTLNVLWFLRDSFSFKQKPQGVDNNKA